MKISWKFVHPQAIWDVDENQIWRNVLFYHCLSNGCSAVNGCRQNERADKNITIIHKFHLLSSPDVNWWTGVVWIIVMILSALILTAPIHCRASIAEHWCSHTFLMKKQTHPNLRWPEDEHFHYVNYSFNRMSSSISSFFLVWMYSQQYLQMSRTSSERMWIQHF